MPGWATKVRFTKNQKGFLIPSYDALLPMNYAIKIIHAPYDKSGSLVNVKSWTSVQQEIDLQGHSDIWEQINEDDPGAAIPGAIWFPGTIPIWDIQEILPIISDPVFRQVMIDLFKSLIALSRQDGIVWITHLIRSSPVYSSMLDELNQKGLNVASIIAKIMIENET